LKQLPIEEYSIAELLDDPISALLMKSDGVDRQGVGSMALRHAYAPELAEMTNDAGERMTAFKILRPRDCLPGNARKGA
jgi:hypothetical protein